MAHTQDEKLMASQHTSIHSGHRYLICRMLFSLCLCQNYGARRSPANRISLAMSFTPSRCLNYQALTLHKAHLESAYSAPSRTSSFGINQTRTHQSEQFQPDNTNSLNHFVALPIIKLPRCPRRHTRARWSWVKWPQGLSIEKTL